MLNLTQLKKKEVNICDVNSRRMKEQKVNILHTTIIPKNYFHSHKVNIQKNTEIMFLTLKFHSKFTCQMALH